MKTHYAGDTMYDSNRNMALFNFRFFLQVFIMLFGAGSVKADNYYYEQVALQDGTFSTVSCIYAEKNGFVWIGTKYGLGRFDGRELKKYISSSEDPHSLPHNNILHISEDSLHNVWILTEKGTVRYRRGKDDFFRFVDQEGRPGIGQYGLLYQ